MKILLGVLHLLVSFALIGVIMMQHRKSGGFTGSFGGGGTQADNSGTWQRMAVRPSPCGQATAAKFKHF